MLISLLLFTLGLAGMLLVSYGAWIISEPVGYIVLGVFLLLASYLYSRQVAASNHIKQAKQESE